MKKLISYLVLTSLIIITVFGTLFITPPEKAAAYDRNTLCSDAGLVNFGSLNAAGIQEFLISKGSFLKSYSQNGRSAAQIIYNAAIENGINPIAILAMIQKEEGLITGTYAGSLNQTRLDWAMGYGYTDSIIYTKYKGFTTQIDYGAWQLKRNYSYYATNGGVWNVGKTMNIDGANVTFGNKCTSSQYRYTPHLGTNFSKYFDAWGGNNRAPAYQAQYVSETRFPTVADGATKTMTISYRNTGSQTWRRGVVNLGTVNTNYTWRLKAYNMAYNWPRVNRPANLDQASVAPGAIGTFTFKIRNNNDAVGNHRLDVGLVAEGIQWFPRATHAYWDVIVAPAYQAQYVSETRFPTVADGATKTMTISYRNTGSQTWRRGVVNLGTVNTNYTWRLTKYDMAYNWPRINRPANLDQASVVPGAIGTFTFKIKNSNDTPGNHRLDVGLVAEGIQWFPRATHAYWDVIAQ